MPRKQKTTKTKLLREITIPVGEDCAIIPYENRTKMEFVSILIALDKAATAELTMYRDDAIRLGLIENPEKEQDDESTSDRAKA